MGLSIRDLVVALFISGLAVYSIMDARAAWRDPHWQPVVLARPRALRNVAARAVIVTSAAALMAAVTAASATHGLAARAITVAVGVPAILGILLGGAAALTLAFWRWPRFLLPAPQRAQPAGPDGSGQALAGLAAPPEASASPVTGAAAGRVAEASAVFGDRPVDPAVIAAAERDNAAVLALARARGGRADRMRAYHVVIDGAAAGRIKRGERLDLPLPAGRHKVYLRIDWCSSRVVDVAARPGEVIKLYCEPAGSARIASRQALAGPGQYIELIRV